VTSDATLHENRIKPLIGAPVERREDDRFLTGRGRYVDDVHIEGMVHAAIYRSAKPHSRIHKVETRHAAKLQGVLGVFTGADFMGQLNPIRTRVAALPRFNEFLQLPIATEKVRYVGEPIAVVIAETPYIAEDALSLISAEIEDLLPVVTWEQACEGLSLVHEAVGTNVTGNVVGRGDASSAFEQAYYVRREKFSVQRHTAVPIETRGLVAQWNAGRQTMTIWGATKIPFFNRTTLAGMLELPESSIVMKVEDVGGGFGVRGEFYPEDFLIPYLARALGRPVKWIEDRREHFMATNHARETVCELEIACTRDGAFVGMRGRLVVDLGAYARGTGSTAPARCAQFLPGPYRIPNFSCEVNAFFSNKTPCGTYRGPGRIEANFFRERLIDMAAADLKIDPAELRRRNLVTAQEMPYSIGQLTTYEPAAHIDSGDYVALFETALKEIGWDKLKPLQGRKIEGLYHGTGFSCFFESGAGGAREQARIRLSADGTLDVFVGSASSGQGHETVFAQVCADTLQLPMDDIRVTCASTDQLEAGAGSFHSRSAVMAGNAVRLAARTFMERLRGVAIDYLGRPNVQLSWEHGAFSQAETRAKVTISAISRYLAARGETIDVTETFVNADNKPFSYGTNAAHVAVDPRSGHVMLLDFVAIEDIGTVLNSMIAHGQAEGAIVQGLGGAFLEHLMYDDEGQLLTASLADYLMPTASDFPNIRGKFLNLAPAPGNPLGAKGGGEGGMVAVAAAIGNAVSAAVSSFGAEIRDLPLSPPRVWRLIKDAESAKAK
jgi:carbon-monoxide dehydrogenase large subunit